MREKISLVSNECLLKNKWQRWMEWHLFNVFSPLIALFHFMLLIISFTQTEIMLFGSAATSLLKSYSSGTFDSSKWLEFWQGEEEEFHLIPSLLEIFNNQHEPCNWPPKWKKKCQWCIILAHWTEGEELKEIPPDASASCLLYIACPNIEDIAFNVSSVVIFNCPTTHFSSLWRKQRKIIRFLIGPERIVVDVTCPLWNW
jgi:hypothetical protein